jgi:hypothetical protein
MQQWGKREPDLPAVGVSVCRRISTMLVIWSVLHTKMALDTKLKQLAFLMISW